MFESANFIDKRNSYKSHYHKGTKTTYKRVKLHFKSDSTGGECNKVFINDTSKWCHVLTHSRFCKLKSFKMQQQFDIV